MTFFETYLSPLGEMLMASEDENSLCGLWFEGQKHFPQTFDWQKKELAVFNETKQWLDAYFNKTILPIPKINPKGTAFQKNVWQQLCKIEYAHTSTYKEIAQLVGCNSARAVGNAIGRNPVSIIIPCHRVIGHSGSLGGYAAGTDKKILLLKHEENLL
ncbi:MAG: methylated-DNA--[protein]-cysteine S-methyltransferase [Bacteroidaceae bacterium]